MLNFDVSLLIFSSAEYDIEQKVELPVINICIKLKVNVLWGNAFVAFLKSET